MICIPLEKSLSSIEHYWQRSESNSKKGEAMKKILNFFVILLVGSLVFSLPVMAKKGDDKPSGWEKGKKVGWDGGELPPGLSKKDAEKAKKDAEKKAKEAEKEAKKKAKDAEKASKEKNKKKEEKAKSDAIKASEAARKKVKSAEKLAQGKPIKAEKPIKKLAVTP